MRKPQLVEDQFYHIYNRGVEKRDVFLDQQDHLRFIHDLYEFNDEEPVRNVIYHFNPKSMEVQPHYIQKEWKPRVLLVDILAFVLMPNHFHLLIRQKRPRGIMRFMQKLGTGYTMYFNQKYERVGGLFQGRYKAALVHDDAHFTYLPSYIHLNPIKIYRGSTSINQKLKFLYDYRWSSFPDYIGRRNFPSVTSRQFFLKFFGGEKEYAYEVRDLLKCRDPFESVSDVVLDDDFKEIIEVQPQYINK